MGLVSDCALRRRASKRLCDAEDMNAATHIEHVTSYRLLTVHVARSRVVSSEMRATPRTVEFSKRQPRPNGRRVLDSRTRPTAPGACLTNIRRIARRESQRYADCCAVRAFIEERRCHRSLMPCVCCEGCIWKCRGLVSPRVNSLDCRVWTLRPVTRSLPG